MKAALNRRMLDGLVLLPALYVAGLILYTLLGRLTHPFDLEWMEGGMLAHAWRIQEWLPVYTEPDADWIPYIYPPGYPAVVAALGQVFGLSMGLGRSVSVAALLSSCAALVFVGRRLQNTLLGVLAACFYLSCFPHSGAFYDLVRPDSLGLAFFAWSVVLGMGGRRSRIVAGLLLSAAFMVKHNYAAYGLAMALGIGVRFGWREALRFGLASAVPSLVFVGILQLGTGGHFLTTLLGIPGVHPMVMSRMFPGGPEELGRHVGPMMLAVSAAFVVLTVQQSRAWWLGVGSLLMGLVVLWVGLGVDGVKNMADPYWLSEWAAWASLGTALGCLLLGVVPVWRGQLHPGWVYGAGVTLSAFATAGLMRAHHGGFLNVWMPVHWVLALGFVVCTAGLRARFRWPVEGCMLLALLGQWATQRGFDPERYRPQPEDLAGGMAFVELLEQCDGPVLSPYAVWLPVLAGHEPSWHLIALWDIAHRDGPYREASRKIPAAARDHHWACVVTATGKPLGYGIPANYRVWQEPKMPRPHPGWIGPKPLVPKSGWRVRPNRILIP